MIHTKKGEKDDDDNDETNWPLSGHELDELKQG